MSSLIRRACPAVKSTACPLFHGDWATRIAPLRHLFALALLGLLTSCQLPPVYVPKKTVDKPVPERFVLTHGPSGIKFMPRVAALGRQGKATGVKQKSSLSVMYKYTDELSRGRGTVKYFLSATVMVVPASVASPDQLRALTRSKIEGTYPEATHKSITGPHGEADYLTYHRDRSEFTDRFSSKSKAAFSAAFETGAELYAYQRGQFTVLYHFQFATIRRNAFSRAIAGFMKTFEAQQVEKTAAENRTSSHS